MPAKGAEVASAEADNGTDLPSASAEGAEDGVREQENLQPEALDLGSELGSPEPPSQAPNGCTDPAGDEALCEYHRRREAKRAAAGIFVEPPSPPSPAPGLNRGSQREHSGSQEGIQEESRALQGSQDIQGISLGGADRAHSSETWNVSFPETEARELLRRCRFKTDTLEEFILLAVDRNNENYAAVYEDVQAERYGAKYLSPSWRLASILRGHPDLGSLEAHELVLIVDEALESRDGWEALPDRTVFDEEYDPRDAFMDAWDTVKTPIRGTPSPVQAIPLVDRWPLECERWASPRDRRYRRLVTLCYWYARLLDDEGEFFLGCQMAGDLLGCSYVQAASYLKRARNGGPLELLEPGTKITGKASEYRFVFEAVEVSRC